LDAFLLFEGNLDHTFPLKGTTNQHNPSKYYNESFKI